MNPILQPGQTCWRIEHADRLRVIIDAEDYFIAVKSAMLAARHDILLIGWDFDTRIRFEGGTPTLDGPNRLDHFLRWLVKRNSNLEVRVLQWNLGLLQSLGRGMMPLALLNLASNKRLHFKLDGEHPVGAAHHQKIVVIDDTIAFCGGIDMTVARWDTRAHRDDEPGRTDPRGKPLGPWHDATTLVDGAAAHAVGDMARDRWQAATGERLQPSRSSEDIWPDGLEPTTHDVDVGIARTLPELGDRAEVREIEALYLAGIKQARRSIYLESQYLAGRRLAEALAERLRETDGPDVVIVLPECITDSWLEHEAMDTARNRLLHMLWDADRYQRFGAYYPVTRGGASIYVHAKIMVIDDRLLRVGSSNLNNRSMGFDTECDLAIEAGDGDDSLRQKILGIRRSLLSEHLDVEPDEFDARLAELDGSLHATTEALRGSGRSLRPFDPASMPHDDSPLAENELLDPEHAAQGFGARLWRGVARLVTRDKSRSSVPADPGLSERP